MRKFIKRVSVLSLSLVLSVQVFATGQTGLSSSEIDKLVLRSMETFQVPGIAVGVIKGGNIVHAKGYGVRRIGERDTVDVETLFGIASTGKSFTTAALALLVDEGKITWDDKVIDYIPAFQLHDPWVTREFRIKDLLIHNSGLGLGAGDLMLFPSPAFSRQEIIQNLKHLKPVSSFRSEYAYDNLLYIVAGEVIAAVSGRSYEEFIDQRIIKPLGMKHCTANTKTLRPSDNIAVPHIVLDSELQVVTDEVKLGEETIFAAAGGIKCSIKSILKWHEMHLNKGKLPNGATFLSEKQQAEIMTSQTIETVSTSSKKWFGTNFSAYGLGWELTDFHGFKMAEHGGGLLGMVSVNAMIPDLDLGVIIYTNQQADATEAILYQVLESYMSVPQRDWVSTLAAMAENSRGEAEKVVPVFRGNTFVPSGSITRYEGTYNDPWLGDVVISYENDNLHFLSLRSEGLTGRMEPYRDNVFIVRWGIRALEADAYVKFDTGYGDKPQGFTMKAVSPLTDFSFDFHDLNFTRTGK